LFPHLQACAVLATLCAPACGHYSAALRLLATLALRASLWLLLRFVYQDKINQVQRRE